MFGFFKKKKSDAETEKFVLELANVASAIESFIGEVDEEIMHRALETYLENSPDEASYTVGDFYLNAFVGAVGQATIEDKIPPDASLNIFTMTQNFIFSSGEYQTDVATKIMNNWQSVLTKKGAI